MLKGINVLYMESIDTYSRGVLISVCILAILIMVGIGLIYHEQFFGIIVALGSASILLFVIAFGDTEPTGRYKYECIIDQSVPLNDVYDRYKVIERRGDIWMLEDKEAVDE